MSPKKPLPSPLAHEDWGASSSNQVEPDAVRLTAAQVAAISQASPSVSPWTVVGWQLIAGVIVASFAWLISGERSVAWSALYGALTVALPASVLARGMSSPLGKLGAVSSAMSFMVWEMVKIGLSVAMLIAAAQLLPDLSWPALLIGMVLTMKVYWLAAVFKPAVKTVLTTSN